MEAVALIWEGPADKTIAQVRRELRAIAAAQKNGNAMPADRRIELGSLLREWSRQDHGCAAGFINGLWDRRALDALIDDVESVIHT